MDCIEIHGETCGLRPHQGPHLCAFLRGQECHIEEHNQAVGRALQAGLDNQPLPEDLQPNKYRLPCEQ